MNAFTLDISSFGVCPTNIKFVFVFSKFKKNVFFFLPFLKPFEFIGVYRVQTLLFSTDFTRLTDFQASQNLPSTS